MRMADDVARRAWVTRVLGYKFPDAAAGAMDFVPLLARWRRARADVGREIAAFGARLLADAAVKSDPRFPFVRAAAAEIPNLLPASGPRIEALLGARNPGPGAAREVIATIDAYRGALDGARGLTRLEDFAASRLGIPLGPRAILTAALDDIVAALRAAA